jgi:hypothetical protein
MIPIKGLTMKNKMTAMLLLFHMSACASTSFKGANKGAAPKPTTIPSVPTTLPSPSMEPTGTPSAVPSTTTIPDCGPQGATSARLLTPEVTSNASNQWVRFEVSLTDCFGKILPVIADTVWFDIDSYTSLFNTGTTGRGMEFSVTDLAGTPLVAFGQIMKFVYGSDMFGHTGNWAHWETSTPITINSTMNKFIFAVNLSNVTLQPRVGPVDGSSDIYLRLGNATVSTQQIRVHGTDMSMGNGN